MIRTVRLSLMLSLVVLASSSPALADVRLPKLFADHMVVQRDRQVPVWGWAEPGERVTVSLAGREAEATADEGGKWRTELEPLSAGGPHELNVAGNNKLTVGDVLVGEVWICSGQSNMEWPVRASDNADEEIAAADHPQIRMFTIEHDQAAEPRDQLKAASWAVCNPENVGGFSAVGYFFGRHLQQELDVPIGLIHTSWGGTLCEAWASREALQGDADFQPILERAQQNADNHNQAARLYNAMLAPIIPYGIRGAIWYQGESNVSRAAQYAKLFPTMIRDWRERWGQGDFPFYYVQLAPYRYGNQDPRNCAELWEAQLKTLELPNTGMAVTMDIGNVGDIHPRNKQDVGRRLALWALAGTYGRDVVYSGPLYRDKLIAGDKILLFFQHSAGGLTTSDSEPMGEFTIAGEDQKFHPAEVTVLASDVVAVHSDKVDEPKAVRFAWHDDAQPNLVNKAGLPASPFRTDNWPLVTAENK
ncbi:MAG: sialate O-acetylesterase [Pirellulales bacterium]